MVFVNRVWRFFLIFTIIVFPLNQQNTLCSQLEGEGTHPRIIQGTKARQGDFPYQVSIRTSYNDNHFCGGAIITSKHILTAAHCMKYSWGGLLPPIIVSVFVGQTHLTSIRNESVYKNASRITIHPNFDPESMANDIAVIELESPLMLSSPHVFDDNVNNVSGVSGGVDVNNWNVVGSDVKDWHDANNNENDNGELTAAIRMADDGVAGDGLECVISGWGAQRFDAAKRLSEELLFAQVKIISRQSCRDKYALINVTLCEGMSCALGASNEKDGPFSNLMADACQGDSGGPLVCGADLAGIISTGKECGIFPGIYSDVAYFRPWIQSVINSSNNDLLQPLFNLEIEVVDSGQENIEEYDENNLPVLSEEQDFEKLIEDSSTNSVLAKTDGSKAIDNNYYNKLLIVLLLLLLLDVIL